jgi:hypothetical protein
MTVSKALLKSNMIPSVRTVSKALLESNMIPSVGTVSKALLGTNIPSVVYYTSAKPSIQS